jgi:hypothetical protein
MNPRSLLVAAILALPGVCAPAAITTIDVINPYAWGANLGWINWRGDTVNGAVIGEYACSGYLYAANVGWINLGGGSPANGIRYQNLSANDFGVNNDGLGNLSGYAWGANIGWIVFGTNGAPKVDLLTGRMSGYVYSANCGWISLSNATAQVQTDTFYAGPLAPNGLPIPWLLSYFGTTSVSASADPTGKGMTIAQDYLAGTDPNNASSRLQITQFTTRPGGVNVSLTWSSVPTRLYYIQKETNLLTAGWTDSGLGAIAPAGGSTTSAGFTDTAATNRFYRVQAMVP